MRDYLLPKDATNEWMGEIDRIIREECIASRIPYAVMVGQMRARSVAWPRQKAMYRAHAETSASLPMIGRAFNRDHTTVMWGIKQYKLRTGVINPQGHNSSPGLRLDYSAALAE